MIFPISLYNFPKFLIKPMKKVFILSGPAGVGKTTIWHNVEARVPHIAKIITTTSRPIRPTETDGVDYHFLSKDEFEAKIVHGDLIEYAVVHTNLYGSTFSELERIIALDKNPIYIIEPQGMIHIKPILEAKGYEVVTIFMLPPSLDDLKKRLYGRGTETAEQYELRLAKAMLELEQKDMYDIKIVNDVLENAEIELITILS